MDKFLSLQQDAEPDRSYPEDLQGAARSEG